MEQTPARNKFIPVLVVIMIVGSFLLGHLYTKVQYLEKGVTANSGGTGGTGGTNNGAVAGDTNNQLPPTAPVDVTFGTSLKQGSAQAKVAVVEFTDYQCPFCKQLFVDTYPQFKKEYVDSGKVAYFVRNFPLNAIHPQAQKAAEAAECAKDQNKFVEYHDKLFNNQNALQIEDLKKYATEVGLNANTFASCLDSGKHKPTVQKDIDDGENAGVRGTPSSFVGLIQGDKINGTQIAGAVPYASFKAEIDKALAEAK